MSNYKVAKVAKPIRPDVEEMRSQLGLRKDAPASIVAEIYEKVLSDAFDDLINEALQERGIKPLP